MDITNELLDELDALLGLNANGSLSTPLPYLSRELLEKSAEHIRAQAAELERVKGVHFQMIDHCNNEERRLKSDLAFARAEQSDSVKRMRELLNRVVPRIDAGGPNPIDPELHHCEYMLYRERERIHAEFDALLAGGDA